MNKEILFFISRRRFFRDIRKMPLQIRSYRENRNRRQMAAKLCIALSGAVSGAVSGALSGTGTVNADFLNKVSSIPNEQIEVQINEFKGIYENDKSALEHLENLPHKGYGVTQTPSIFSVYFNDGKPWEGSPTHAGAVLCIVKSRKRATTPFKKVRLLCRIPFEEDRDDHHFELPLWTTVASFITERDLRSLPIDKLREKVEVWATYYDRRDPIKINFKNPFKKSKAGTLAESVKRVAAERNVNLANYTETTEKGEASQWVDGLKIVLQMQKLRDLQLIRTVAKLAAQQNGQKFSGVLTAIMLEDLLPFFNFAQVKTGDVLKYYQTWIKVMEKFWEQRIGGLTAVDLPELVDTLKETAEPWTKKHPKQDVASGVATLQLAYAYTDEFTPIVAYGDAWGLPNAIPVNFNKVSVNLLMEMQKFSLASDKRELQEGEKNEVQEDRNTADSPDRVTTRDSFASATIVI